MLVSVKGAEGEATAANRAEAGETVKKWRIGHRFPAAPPARTAQEERGAEKVEEKGI